MRNPNRLFFLSVFTKEVHKKALDFGP